MKVVVDQSFKENYGMKLGDVIQLNGSESGLRDLEAAQEIIFH